MKYVIYKHWFQHFSLSILLLSFRVLLGFLVDSALFRASLLHFWRQRIVISSTFRPLFYPFHSKIASFLLFVLLFWKLFLRIYCVCLSRIIIISFLFIYPRTSPVLFFLGFLLPCFFWILFSMSVDFQMNITNSSIGYPPPPLVGASFAKTAIPYSICFVFGTLGNTAVLSYVFFITRWDKSPDETSFRETLSYKSN